MKTMMKLFLYVITNLRIIKSQEIHSNYSILNNVND